MDEAVLRVLELKFEQGLFEHPYMEENMRAGKEYGTDQVSEKLAAESVVLLKNEQNLLPIRTDPNKKEEMKIAVIGPNANDRYRQLGDYTPPVAKKECCTIWQGI